MGLFNWFNDKKSVLKTEKIYSEENLSAETDSIEEIVIAELPNLIETEAAPIEKPVEDKIPKEEFNCSDLGIYDPTLDLAHYLFPELSLLNEQEPDNDENQIIDPNRVAEILESFGIKIKLVKINNGAIITLFEMVLGDGIKIATLRKLQEDIAIGLSVSEVMIVPVPEKGTVGIVISNKNPQILTLSSVLNTKEFRNLKYELPVAIGNTITNEPFFIDLVQMPHLLIAGATGQGKSVALNAMIISLLYKKHPAELKLVLIDPRIIEFNIYSPIQNHFLAQLPNTENVIVSGLLETNKTLNSLVKEMDDRYHLLAKSNSRDIKEHNEKFVNRKLNPSKGHRYLPYIVTIIDEFGDLLIAGDNSMELALARLTSKAHTVGIHLIISTQRPTAKVITSAIKANFPARMAFKVASSIDSRIILEESGAEQLFGVGDSLFSHAGKTTRVQAAYISTAEVENVMKFIGMQPGYPTPYMLPEYLPFDDESEKIDLSEIDTLFEEAARLIVIHQQGSTSLIQRKFAIGYNRAGRLLSQLEAAGIVGPSLGSRARDVLIADEYHLEKILNNLH
jgi:S-DNA-T family DNA segregation ATPase FtsK/SpoIIIE